MKINEILQWTIIITLCVLMVWGYIASQGEIKQQQEQISVLNADLVDSMQQQDTINKELTASNDRQDDTLNGIQLMLDEQIKFNILTNDFVQAQINVNDKIIEVLGEQENLNRVLIYGY